MLSDVFNEIISFVSTNHFLAVFYICIIASFTVLIYKSNELSPMLSGIKRSLAPSTALIIYSVFSSLLLANPLSALLFRKFQTVFFSYSTLWVMIPVVPLSAAILTTSVDLLKKTKKAVFIFSLILSLFMLLCCGRFGSSIPKIESSELPGLKDKEITFYQADPVLERLSSLPEGSTILASPAITEYIRQYTGHIKTLYGRDIWDSSLAAYNYNSYSEETVDLYEWMLYSDFYGCIYYLNNKNIITGFNYEILDHSVLDEDPNWLGGVKFARIAKDMGVSVICFTINEKTDMAGLEHLKAGLSAESEFIEVDSEYDFGYYLLFLN